MTQPPKYHYPNVFQRIGRAMDRAGIPWWAVLTLVIVTVALFVFSVVNSPPREQLSEYQTEAGGMG